jgi:hypothetical protein
MRVLIDSSIWIDYFRSGANSSRLDYLIDENLVVINAVILAELVPFLEIKKQKKIVELLGAVERLPMNINWDQVTQFQLACLQAGINGVGIPDLLIAQNAMQNQCKVYALDKHFHLLHQIIRLDLLV